MAKITPFKAVRPVPDRAEKIACYPYDVIDSNEARELAKGNPLSFLHVEKSEIDLDPSVDLYDESVYRTAADNLKKLMIDGHMIQETKECLYIYRQKMGDHEQYSIVACSAVSDYVDDVIKKHELTRADKEADRTRHADIVNANCGPIFLTYKAKKSIDDIIAKIVKCHKPVYDFTADKDGIWHTVWIIDDDATIEKLCSEFEKLNYLYVADGHHRSASAANVGIKRKKANPDHTGREEYNRFMVALFPDNQLKILPYNRVIKDLNGLSKSDFFKKIEDKFEITETTDKEPKDKHTFSMYLENKWYRLVAKKGSYKPNDPVENLDVTILQKNLFEPILAIGDPRKDKRINFVGGIRGTKELEKLVNSGNFKIAFSMYPTTVNDLMSIADAGKIMPPKSTWFEPKLRSGLLIHIYDDEI